MMISAAVGWLGAAGTMGAYGLVSQGRLQVTSVRYQVINVVGAGMLAVSALSADNWPSFASNLVWGLIALLSLFRAPRSLAHTVGTGVGRVCALLSSPAERGPAPHAAADSEAEHGRVDLERPPHEREALPALTH